MSFQWVLKPVEQLEIGDVFTFQATDCFLTNAKLISREGDSLVVFCSHHNKELIVSLADVVQVYVREVRPLF